MNDLRLNDHEAKRTDTRAKKRLTSEASSQVGVPVSAFAKLPSSGKGPVMTPEDLTHRVKKDCVPMIEAAIEQTMPTFHVVVEPTLNPRGIQAQAVGGREIRVAHPSGINTLYVPGMEIEKSSFSQELMQEKNAKLMPRSPEDIVGVVIHTGGASKSSTMNSLQKRGFSTHFVIETDGKVSQALPLSMIGSHAGKANASTIGIDLTHGKGYNDKNAEYVFTRPESIKQLISLAKLIIALGESHPSIYNKKNTDWVHNAKPSDQTTDKFPGVSAHNHVPGTHTDPGEIYMQMVYLMIALTDSLQHIHGPLAPQISADLDLIVSEFNKVMENAQLPLGTYDELFNNINSGSLSDKAQMVRKKYEKKYKDNALNQKGNVDPSLEALKYEVGRVRSLYND